MELASIIFLAFVVIVLALLIVALVKGYPAIGLPHTIILSLLFVLSLVFVFFSAAVQQKRVAGVVRYEKAKQRNLQLLEDIERTKLGELTTPTTDVANLMPLLAELDRLNQTRGRVWRNAVPRGWADGVATVALQPPGAVGAGGPGGLPPGIPAPPPAAAEGEAAETAAPQELSPQMVVYVFGEGPRPEDGLIVPQFFLGEFFVTESGGGVATLRPTLELSDAQQEALQNARYPRWSIYELMPQDSHHAFAVPGSEPTIDEIFGRMDPERISRLLELPLELLEKPISEMTIDEMIKADVLRSYVLDGQRAPELTPPRNQWLRIKFLAETEVQVDSGESRNAIEGGYFDSSGRTVDERLKRGPGNEKVTFRPGDEVIFPYERASELIDRGEAELLQRYYVRSLNDYAYLFKEMRRRQEKTVQDLERVRREAARIKETDELGRAQIVAKQAERKRLNDDLGQLRVEQQVATAEVERLAGQVQEVKTELSGLFRRSQEVYRTLVQVQQATVAAELE